MLNNLILQLMTLGLNILFVVTVIINNLMFFYQFRTLIYFRRIHRSTRVPKLICLYKVTS